MADWTADSIVQRAFDLGLVDDRRMKEVWGEVGRGEVGVDDVTQLLLRREILTNFQLERLLRGERGGFFYGNYKVLYLVAGGSFARVYRAVHKDNNQIVALKVLRNRYSDDAAQADHFCREGNLGVSLRHPNIVPIYEVSSQGRTHFLVMEFVEGNNLREFMRLRKKLSPAEATRLAADVAAGLQYAAQRGIYHRDLKLTNVLVSSRGQAKLVDFGLAGADTSVADDELADKLNQRTIDYAGLERATGVRRDDSRSDIYFIGSIYYHMLTGQAPLHETRDRIQRLSKTRYLEVKPIDQVAPELPRCVVDIVNKAMDLNPDNRFQTPGQMLVDLKIAADQLAAPAPSADGAAATAAAQPSAAKRAKLEAKYLPDSLRRALMVVESSSQWQDTFRTALKNSGYRVLVFGDPQRALARFEEPTAPAECVLFSSTGLGERAVEAFESFARCEATANVPAVLLLDAPHAAWHDRVKPLLARHRVVVGMPVKLKHLRQVLEKILPPVAAG